MNTLQHRVSCTLKMAANTGKTIFDLPHTPMAESVLTSSAVLADLKNVGVALGISLLSCIEAEILRYVINTSGNGGHL